MLPVYSAAEMRAIDRAAPDPVEVLVERAGSAVARVALRMLGGGYGRRVVVVAGPGNNGNDGRVAARRLAERGVRVTVVDPAAAAATTIDESIDLVIDAAYGTGFRGTWRPPHVGEVAVLAVDIPSGVHADLGTVAGAVLPATRTVTFAALKPGLLLHPGAALAGTIEVADIGLPLTPADTFLIVAADVAAAWPRRAAESHKWRHAVRVIAGGVGMTGAAALASSAAQRTGAGIVQLCSPAGIVAGAALEVVQHPLHEPWGAAAVNDLDRVHAVALGPGLGRSTPTVSAVAHVVAEVRCPMVIDGDGLYAVAGQRAGSSAGDSLAGLGRGRTVVLTPHDGEFALLDGAAPGEDRIAAAHRLAEHSECVVLLKGPTTIVAEPGGRTLLVNNGDQRLATAGSGDVLTGIIAAGLAGGLDAGSAAALGAFVHAATLDRLPAHGVIASDLVASLPATLDALLATEPHRGRFTVGGS